MIRKVPDDKVSPDEPDELSEGAEAPEGRLSGALGEAAGNEDSSAESSGDETSGDEPADESVSETVAESGQTDEPASAADAPADDDAGSDDTPAPGPKAGAGLPLGHRIEALLLATGQPLAARRLGQLLGEDIDDIHAALEELKAHWDARPGAIDLVEIANGFRFMTRPEFADVVGLLLKKKGPERLSPAALETLAVVAYRQPIERSDIEGVRGVQCGPLLRVLLDRDLIRVAGKSPEPGHPLLYGTTKRFLDHFGLRSLKALPDISDLLETS